MRPEVRAGSRGQPTLDPFDNRDAARIDNILIEPGADQFCAGIEPVKIDVKQRQAATSIFIEQGKRR